MKIESMSNYDRHTVAAVEAIIDRAHEMKNSYFWTSPSTAKERRAYEERNSCDLIEWAENGHEYTAEYSVSCSCRNIYSTGIYTKDGTKTTLTAIKASLKRMKQALTEEEI